METVYIFCSVQLWAHYCDSENKHESFPEELSSLMNHCVFSAAFDIMPLKAGLSFKRISSGVV